MRISNRCQLFCFKAGVFTAFKPAQLFIELRTGAPPASIEDPAAGTQITQLNPGGTATLLLPQNGVIEVVGAWSRSSMQANGTVGHFRLRRGSSGTTDEDLYAGVFVDGTVTLEGEGGDLEIPSVALTTQDSVSVDALLVALAPLGLRVAAAGTLA